MHKSDQSGRGQIKKRRQDRPQPARHRLSQRTGRQTGASPDYVQWLVATKATRPRTRPGDASKSSAKCLSPRAIRLQSAGWAATASRGDPSPAC